MKTNPMFKFVGYNRLFTKTDETPNDPLYSRQWHLPLMNMPQAWRIEKGSAAITIAVIDSGIDTTHPDLVAR